jgi:hypothetical protein
MMPLFANEIHEDWASVDRHKEEFSTVKEARILNSQISV